MAAFYAFGLPMLGLIDVGSCAMFANLKAHGGSNHLFLPTGLLQRWFAGAAPDGSRSLLDDLKGGVVCWALDKGHKKDFFEKNHCSLLRHEFVAKAFRTLQSA